MTFSQTGCSRPSGGQTPKLAFVRCAPCGEVRFPILPWVGEKRSGVNALSGHSGSILKFPPECSLLRGFAAPLQLSGERERPMLSVL